MYDFDIEPPTHAQRWRGYEPTSEQEAAALVDCANMAIRADEDSSYEKRCIAGEKVFYYDYYKGLMPGHIYSDLGRDEYSISRSCEYHFDEWTKEPEDNVD